MNEEDFDQIETSIENLGKLAVMLFKVLTEGGIPRRESAQMVRDWWATTLGRLHEDR